MPAKNIDELIALCKRRGFIFQSSEVYGGTQGLYDYGPLGVELKNNIKNSWWKSVVYERDDVEGLDASILTKQAVLKYSGHEETFTDPLVDCKSCGERFRADQVPDYCKKEDLTEPRQFNLMFKTNVGPIDDGKTFAYLRPETAQQIFTNFKNVVDSTSRNVPFGIAQTGKAFRNEIVARQFIFRMREFEQMEMQFFIPPGTQKEWYDKWKNNRLKWHLALDMGKEKYRFHDHEKLAHYADAATDIEFRFPFGFKELEGIHSRTDFDLSNHEKYTGKKLQYFDPEQNKNYIPYVVETSIGLDRMFLAVFSNSLSEEIIDGGTSRIVLKLPPALAPIKVAILPLVKKDGLPELAHKISRNLKWDLTTAYDEKDAVGRRYRRQDALGTPYCVTVDHQSLNDKTVTIRERDSMNQERVSIDNLTELIGKKVSVKSLLEKLA